MSCFYPRDAWKSRHLTENGKRQVVFSRRDGYEEMQLQVPCGKCVGCRADRASEWSVRCYQEASLFSQNCFVTLTYRDPCPLKLDKSHLVNFIKRLRHKAEFRYFACGEYGGKTKRPHYHLSVFGQDFLGVSARVSEGFYVSQTVQDFWGFGHVELSPFSMATACYVAGYVAKKIIDTESDAFQVASKGIGFQWLERNWDDVRRLGFVLVDGEKYPVPRAYLKRSDDKLNGVLDNVKRDRRARFDDMDIERKIDLRRELAAKEVEALQRIRHQRLMEKL